MIWRGFRYEVWYSRFLTIKIMTFPSSTLIINPSHIIIFLNLINKKFVNSLVEVLMHL